MLEFTLNVLLTDFRIMQSIIPTTQVLYVKYLTVDVMIVIAAVVNLNNMVLFQNL